jgi:hypothetical protein
MTLTGFAGLGWLARLRRRKLLPDAREPACGAGALSVSATKSRLAFHHFSFDILWHASEHSGLAPGFLGTNCRLQTWHVFGSSRR